MTVVRDQLFPQKPPGSRFRFSRTRVQPSPGSSTIELPSAFAESGAYPPDRELPGSPRQCSLPLACRHPPEGHQIGARKRRTPENTILSQPYCRRVSTDRPNREGSQLAASLEGEPGPTPAGKTLPYSYPENRFRRERARDYSRAATLPKGTKLELGRAAHLGTPSSANHTAAASRPTGWIAKAVSWLHFSRVNPAVHPPERPSHTHTPKRGLGGRRHVEE